MRFEKGYRSKDVIDRRGERGGGGGGGGGGAALGLVSLLLRTRYGWVGLVLLVLYWLYAGGPGGGGGGGGSRPTSNVSGHAPPVAEQTPQDDDQTSFVHFVLDEVQNTWEARSPIEGHRYRRAKLILFTDAVRTACGHGDAAVGPFYCPADEHVYIDLGFYRDLRGRLGAPGDFAQAYVIAHEIGHHLQNILGTSEQVHRAPEREQKGADGLSVRLELQADCYAGVWAHASQQKQLLEAGDIEEALNAAQAIGDDRLQKMARGHVRPETFSHGTSAQRAKWFRRGYESGDASACDTFSIAAP